VKYLYFLCPGMHFVWVCFRACFGCIALRATLAHVRVLLWPAPGLCQRYNCMNVKVDVKTHVLKDKCHQLVHKTYNTFLCEHNSTLMHLPVAWDFGAFCGIGRPHWRGGGTSTSIIWVFSVSPMVYVLWYSRWCMKMQIRANIEHTRAHGSLKKTCT